ncbi:MAG: O-antigen ligase family protein, partial [Acidobacteria bacterium]|nr:O-antigen ligase family protein [Acidobacteriota bacterium]
FADIWRTGEFKFSTSLLQLPILGLIVIGLLQLLPIGGDRAVSDLLSIGASNAISLDPMSTKFAIIKLVVFLTYFAVALVYVNSPERIRKVIYTIIIFGAVMAFIGVLQRLASPNFIYGMREVDYATPFASYVNQHHFAAFMEMTIGLTLGLLFGNSIEKDKRLLLVIAVILMGIAIIFTGSRGGFLSLVGVIAFLVLANINLRQKKSEAGESGSSPLKRNLTLIGGSVLLIAVLLTSVIWLGEGSVRRIGDVSQPDFTNGRLHFWGVSLQIIRDHPVFGAGLEAFGVAYTKYDDWDGNLRVEQAHNDYLQILADAGILGLVFICGFIFLLFKKSLNVINDSANRFRRGVAIGSLAGCFGILVHSFFDFPLRTNANMLFFLLLVVLATATIHYPKLYRKPRLVQAS